MVEMIEVFEGTPVPAWSRVENDQTEEHSCSAIFYSPIPADEDIEWEWTLDYALDTLQEQLGLDLDTVAPYQNDSWVLAEEDDGPALFLTLMLISPDCPGCEALRRKAEEEEKEMAYCRGEQGALF